MTPADSLYAGQWVAISGDRAEQAMDSNPFLMRVGFKSYTGEACQILAISPPWLLVWVARYDRTETIDLRRFQVVRLSRGYVRQLLQVPLAETTDVATGGDEQVEGAAVELGGCPVCGARLVERMTVGEQRWHYYCQECGFTGRTNEC